jgi:hypothetical protein
MTKSQIFACVVIAALVGGIGAVCVSRTASMEAHAGELGYAPSALPGSVDEFGHIVRFQKDGAIYSRMEIENLMRGK